jgi:hypothetical protein
MNTHYIVQSASAAMPLSCKGRYRRVGVLRVEAELDHVSMISTRARGCHEVVRTWERLHADGVNTAYGRALIEARAYCATLNAGS